MINKKIIFIGMMGSGKSTIAKKLSEIKNIKLYETDEIFEQKENIKIKDFFEKYSETEFRKKEKNILKDILNNDSFIISSGGGIILDEENRLLIFNKDIISIYLRADYENIYQRIKNDKTRPLLLVKNPKKEIEKILNIREKYYQKANVIIDTNNKTINEIINEIEQKLWKQ